MNIWVIRPGALGDTLLVLPLLYTIKESNARASVTLFGSGAYRELIPPEFSFRPIDHSDSMWLFQPDYSSGARSDEPCDVAYVILKDPENVISNLRRAGVEKVFPVCPVPEPGHHLLERLRQELGLPVPERFPVLKGFGKNANTQNLIWAHPGSGGRKKLAPLDLFREVTGLLRARTGCDIAITLGEADEELKGHRAWKQWLEESGATILENRTLQEVCDDMAGARFFVGNDSGISHLAANLGVRSILFYMSTDPVQWAPWVPSNQTLVLDYREGGKCRGTHEEAITIVESALSMSP